jgi:hypothetical protein
VKLSQWAFSPPCLKIFQCNVVIAGCVHFQLLVVGHEQESLGRKIDDVTLATNPVGRRIVSNVESSKEA